MRFRILLLSFMLLTALFPIRGISVDWDNPGTQSVDQMLSGSEYGATSSLPGNYVSPATARAAESSQKGKEILNAPIGGKLNSVGNNPKETRADDQTQISFPENNTTNTPAPVIASATNEPASISGSWSLELIDSASHNAVLTLFQSGDAIYGSGNMNLDANTTLLAAASGTLSGNDLNLDLITLGKVKLYRLDMAVSADLTGATGNYTAYSPSGSPATGTVKGSMAAS